MATKRHPSKGASAPPTASASRGPHAGGAPVAGGAKSTKVVTDKGSHVTTVANSATATAGEPETTLEVTGAAVRSDLGFGVRGVTVDGVTKGGLAEKRGVRAGWVVTKVASKVVASENEVVAALAAAKKAGKAYSVTFQTCNAAVAVTSQPQPSADGGSPAMPSAPPEPAAPASAAAVEEAAEAERKAKAKAEEEEATKKQAAEKEEEERRKAAEAEEAARKQREAEEAATRAEELAAQARRNGKARFRYEMYDQEFEIANGSLTQEVIDEEFAFTFVMPGCHVHLSESSPSEVTALKNQGSEPSYVMERPQGVYFGLETGKTYWCYVEQDAAQLKKDQDSNKARLASDKAAAGGGGKKEDGRGFESCSCIYGAPCVDEYGCRDWTNRFAVAKKNGWKGF